MSTQGHGRQPGPRLPRCIERFSLFQKASTRFCLYGFVATGIVAMFLGGAIHGILYLVCCGVAGIVILNCFCAHCPYPDQYKTCLAMPPSLPRRLARLKPGPLSSGERVAFVTALAALILIPQYWLWQRLPLMIVYWLFCLPTCFVFPFYFCKRCRFAHCPFNPRGHDAGAEAGPGPGSNRPREAGE